MKPTTLMTRTAMAALMGAGLTLAACNNSNSVQSASSAPPPAGALPLTTAAAPPIADAPPASQLPPAPPAPIAQVTNPSDSYAYADQASSEQYGFGDAPPDYTFDYDGSRPWVWHSNDDYTEMVEPLANGDRYYYYRPGADYPYLVRDPDYSYGYDNGDLVAVYDSSGRVLSDDYARRRADIAGRYLARAEALYRASRQNEHQAVAAANWQARQAALTADHQRWRQDETQDQGWRAYHDQHADQDEAHWDQERYQRQAEAARTAQTFNDVAAAALLWQSARQAQDHGRAHGQNFGGGQQFGGHDQQSQGPQGIPPQGGEYNGYAPSGANQRPPGQGEPSHQLPPPYAQGQPGSNVPHPDNGGQRPSGSDQHQGGYGQRPAGAPPALNVSPNDARRPGYDQHGPAQRPAEAAPRAEAPPAAAPGRPGEPGHGGGDHQRPPAAPTARVEAPRPAPGPSPAAREAARPPEAAHAASRPPAASEPRPAARPAAPPEAKPAPAEQRTDKGHHEPDPPKS